MAKITYLERNPEMILPEPVEEVAAMSFGVSALSEESPVEETPETVHSRTGSVRAIERVRSYSIRHGKPLAEQEMSFEEFRRRQRDRGISIEPREAK